MINNEHTPSGSNGPMFGEREVGIGFSVIYDDGAGAFATALAGKRNIRFRAVLEKLVKA